MAEQKAKPSDTVAIYPIKICAPEMEGGTQSIADMRRYHTIISSSNLGASLQVARPQEQNLSKEYNAKKSRQVESRVFVCHKLLEEKIGERFGADFLCPAL